MNLLNPRYWFQKRTGAFAAAGTEQMNRMRYNALFALDPDVLVRHIAAFNAGDIAGLEHILEEFENREDKMKIGAFKMSAAVASKPWEVRIAKGEEDNERAKLHQEVLTRFWNRIETTDAFCRNRRGGVRTLVKQMMSAQSRMYAVHDVAWKVRGDGELEALFTFVPAWMFENRTGELRFLKEPGAYTGVPMNDGEWLVTVGEGIGISAAILAMAKRLSWNDWLLFSEKCGMPVILGNTGAKEDTPAWKHLLHAIANVAPKTGILADLETKLQAVQIGGSSGQTTYRELIEVVDRGISALYRGGDLATMSQGTDGVGSNSQDGESELMDADGCSMISETLHRQIDRHVIRFTCGDFEPLAGIVINPPAETEDIDREIKIDQHLGEFGVKLSKKDMLARYGRVEAQDESDAAELQKTPQPGLQDGFNGLANEVQPQTDKGDPKALRELLGAFSRDLGPAAEEVKKLLADLEAGKDVTEEAKSLVEKLPELMPEDPAMAAVLAEEMAKQFGAVELENEVQRVPSGHGNGGQFTGKTNQPATVTHTPEEEKRIADYEASTDQSVVDFYEQIKGIDDAETLSKAKCKIGIVSHEYAARVKELTGLDTEGWTIELRGNRAKHIDIRHGGSGKQDQSLADSNDVGRINYVMQNFDSVDYCYDQHGNKVLSGEYQDKNGPAPVLETRMKIDGTFAVQEAVPDSKWKKIYIVSARIEKSKEP